MKKRAFTMVELIFVIVILGILAAVAAPKLNASREDAQKAVLKANIRTVFKDLETYYAANGTFGSDFKPAGDFTNVPMIEGRLNAQKDKDCIDFAVRANTIWFRLRRVIHPICAEVLEDPAIRQLFEGYEESGLSFDSTTNDATPNEGAVKSNAVDNKLKDRIRILNEDGVSWD